MSKNLKILYLQIRQDEETRNEEFAEFVRFSGIESEQFTTLNVFDVPIFEPSIIDTHDALFVGGSSDASVLEPDTFPFVPSTERLMQYVVERAIPTFASCYGFQAAVIALGGEVIEDRPNMEMGTYPLTLTEEAHDDLLFHDTPNPFMAVSGHKLRATRLPVGCTNLVYSDLCPFHAFRVEGAPFYATQFHPEVDREDLIARITRYKERYLDADGELDAIISSARAVPDANALLRKFVERVLL